MWNLLAQSQSFQSARFPDLRYITNTGGALPACDTDVDCDRVLTTTDVYSDVRADGGIPLDVLAILVNWIGVPDRSARRSRTPRFWSSTADGRLCVPGEVGELVHHGPTVSLGYWNQPELTQRVLRPHPFPPPGHATPPIVCYSGDLVYADAEGFLYFVARKDDQIKTSGFRVSPTEVEAVLHEHPAVVQAAVVGSRRRTARPSDSRICRPEFARQPPRSTTA